MSLLGTGIDKLEVDGLQMLSRRMLHQTLTKDEGTLLDTNDGTLKHHPILVDFTIVDKTTHWGDALLGQISLGLATGFISLLSNMVDLLVHLGTVEVSCSDQHGGPWWTHGQDAKIQYRQPYERPR